MIKSSRINIDKARRSYYSEYMHRNYLLLLTILFFIAIISYIFFYYFNENRVNDNRKSLETRQQKNQQ